MKYNFIPFTVVPKILADIIIWCIEDSESVKCR